VVLICYFLCSIGEFLNVKWTNPNLQSTYFKSGNVGSLKSAAILAVQGTGYRNIPGVLNGCIIFAVLTTSNTALYVASRTLYGMTRQLRPNRFPITWLSKAGKADMTGIPMWALLISFISLIWLPLLSLKGGVAVHDVSSGLSNQILLHLHRS
jgi:yeast amino acid transporter